MFQTRSRLRLRPLWLSAVLSLGLAAAVAFGIQSAGPAQAGQVHPTAATAATDPNVEKYLGTWNYDQPDRASMRDIAVISCPPASTSCRQGPDILVPQIGTIVFSRNATGGIVGHTDQGCTWTFAVRSNSLELDPPSQYCFNHVIGSAYTITQWTVTVVGQHEQETVVATSHQPYGDYEFRLQTGSRTKVTDRDWSQAVRLLHGTWQYDAADLPSRVNMVFTRYTTADGQTQSTQAPLVGVVTLTAGPEHRVTARTEDGCRWTLDARGNTAELAPAGQTCHTSAGTVTLTFWSIASDGTHQASIMAGIDAHDGSFLLSVGSLTKTQP
jgi:hypothetical protein